MHNTVYQEDGMPGRKLKLKARAERMQQTRERIVQAAFDLHRTVGPARTTVSAIAKAAGVQRHTVYQHFPDELALSAACTELGLALDPQPDPGALEAIAASAERTRSALQQQYAYYRRNDALLANVLRDAPTMQAKMQAAGLSWEDLPPAVRSFFDQPQRVQAAVVAGWAPSGESAPSLGAVCGLAVGFETWRLLCREHAMDDASAAALMSRVIECIAG
jgi:AcrR family transcriptional regulator